MDLNLRKARKLEQKIQKHLDAQRFTVHSEVRVKGTVEQAQRQIDVDKKIFLDDLQQANALLELRFNIRARIAQANTNLGINDLMNRKELLEAKSRLLSKATSNPGLGRELQATPSEQALDDVLKARAGILDRSTSEYGISATTAVSIFTEADIETFEQQGRTVSQQTEDIEDDLSQKNIGGKVSLTTEEVALLKAVGLV